MKETIEEKLAEYKLTKEQNLWCRELRATKWMSFERLHEESGYEFAVYYCCGKKNDKGCQGYHEFLLNGKKKTVPRRTYQTNPWNNYGNK